MLEYMSLSERKRFDEAKEAGGISFFRIGSCAMCGSDVYKGVRFCSPLCFKTAKEIGMDDKTFVELVAKLLNKSIRVETKDGVYLQGKLTLVEVQTIIVDGVRAIIQTALKLDDDSEKVVELTRIVNIEKL